MNDLRAREDFGDLLFKNLCGYSYVSFELDFPKLFVRLFANEKSILI